MVNLFEQDWYKTTWRKGRPTVAVAIYHDDAIDHGLVERLGAAHIPLIAVISGDPQRPYRNGGITYDYDEENHVYIGHSAGRADNFKYRPSPFARLRSVPLHYCNMHTVM